MLSDMTSFGLAFGEMFNFPVACLMRGLASIVKAFGARDLRRELSVSRRGTAATHALKLFAAVSSTRENPIGLLLLQLEPMDDAMDELYESPHPLARRSRCRTASLCCSALWASSWLRACALLMAAIMCPL